MTEQLERVGRELVYKGHIIDLYEDSIRVPNGNIVKWDFIGHKGAAAVLPVLPDGRILLVQQFRNALDRFTWEIPAGGRNTLADGSLEGYLECAHRELEEETGYKTKISKMEFLVSLKMAVAYCEEQIDVFVAEDLEKSSQRLDEDEFIRVKAFTLDEICDRIAKGQMQDAKTIASVMSYKAKRRL
ncbi:MAG: NUDIX hydrolase [Lachnospiraceae bacterium]|nr:NUDIX hydrolase [Lachnospiraceae bacterium]